MYKRGNVWWVRFTTPGGKLVRQSSQTEDKQAAQELHDKLKAESWRVAKLGQKPNRTWDEAAYRWLQETQHKKSHHTDEFKLKWLQQYLSMKPLHEITRDVVMTIAEIKRKQTSPSTANRIIALVRSILRRAEREWEWIERTPLLRLYPEPKRRIRWITPEQAHKLLSLLPGHQRDIVAFALATGLRQANVLKLEWSQVDMERKVAWIHADQAKAGRDIHISLNQTALVILRRQIGKHPERVFTFKGNPIAWANTRAWREALKKAEISNFRWHDLRHTWASWLVQNGVPLSEIQEMGGWESHEMVRRYAHLSPAHLATRAQVLDKLLGTNSAHPEDVASVSLR
ncbi:MAG: tyrosine-type recombinase/integrase [Terriglobia bacterium]